MAAILCKKDTEPYSRNVRKCAECLNLYESDGATTPKSGASVGQSSEQQSSMSASSSKGGTIIAQSPKKQIIEPVLKRRLSIHIDAHPHSGVRVGSSGTNGAPQKNPTQTPVGEQG